MEETPNRMVTGGEDADSRVVRLGDFRPKPVTQKPLRVLVAAGDDTVAQAMVESLRAQGHEARANPDKNRLDIRSTVFLYQGAGMPLDLVIVVDPSATEGASPVERIIRFNDVLNTPLLVLAPESAHAHLMEAAQGMNATTSRVVCMDSAQQSGAWMDMVAQMARTPEPAARSR